MQVYFIPLGSNRYEPYFEPVESVEPPEDGDTGWLGRMRRRFSQMLREAEEERHRRHEPTAAEASSRVVRWRRALMRWIVERAAEQRLLWHLRTATHATLHVPDDLAEPDAVRLLQLGLARDADRHRRWFVIHLLCLGVAALFFFIPGPNLVGYFFTFTTIGHLMAWRGAANGRTRVAWQVTPSDVLRELRQAEVTQSPERETRVHAVAARLGLRHLATFVERLAVPPA